MNFETRCVFDVYRKVFDQKNGGFTHTFIQSLSSEEKANRFIVGCFDAYPCDNDSVYYVEKVWRKYCTELVEWGV